MIAENKQAKALKAVHDLIIEAKIMAYKKTDHQVMADFLDDVEYLPALILETSDRTDFFEQYLKETCVKSGYIQIWNRYQDL